MGFRVRFVATQLLRIGLAGGALVVSTARADAVPVLGAQLFATGGSVTVEVLHSTAAYTSDLFLFSPDSERLISTNRDVGLVVDLGRFPVGMELLFGIKVENVAAWTYFMGQASRNPDGIAHAIVDLLAAGDAIVGFEDLSGGGDRDFDDVVFRFRGVVASTADVDERPVDVGEPSADISAPEPATLLLLGAGLTGLAVKRSRRR